MGSWKGLRKRAARFEAAGATLIGAACDSPAQLRAFREEHRVDYTMLSDPELLLADAIDAPRATRKAYYATLALHPVIRRYPKPSFLQPALFVWKDGVLVYEWRQTESVKNLFGAKGRPTGDEILEIVESALG